MAEELAHDANEELDGTTTDSLVVTGSGLIPLRPLGPTLPRVIFSSGLSCPSSPTSLSQFPPWVLGGFHKRK